MSFLFLNRSNKTFKPKKNIPEGTHQYDLMKHAAATLGSGDLRLAVMLPEGEDLNEWVAVNIVDFFNQINMLYGTITEFCTEESCPLMSAGPKYEYHWADGTTVKKPIKCSAPKYIDYLMTWVQDQLDDENIFPSKIGVPFPKNFISIAKTILKRLFRVYAHIYHQHFPRVVQLDEEAHLNTSFKHFIFFVQEFNLIDKRELAPLSELIEKLIEKRNNSNKGKIATTSSNQNEIPSQNINQNRHHYHHHHHHNHNSPVNNQYVENASHNNYTSQGKPPIKTPPIDHIHQNYYATNTPMVKQAPPNQQQQQYPMKKAHPPPYFPINKNNIQQQVLQSSSHHYGLPTSRTIYQQPPSSPTQTQYYNIVSNTIGNLPPPPPTYHQHLHKQQHRNLNLNSAQDSGGGGLPR